MSDQAPAGWVVRVVNYKTGKPPRDRLYAVASSDPSEALERVKLVSGANANASFETTKPLSRPEVIRIGLRLNEVRIYTAL
jgi:hypothetical protein